MVFLCRRHKSFLNTSIPCLLALGGGNEQHPHLSEMAKNPATLSQLVRNFITYAVEPYNFSGVHVDWRYPGTRCGNPSDKNNLLLMLIAFKAALGKRMLTMSMPNDLTVLKQGFDVPAMFDIVENVIVSADPEPRRLIKERVHCRNNARQAKRIIRRFRRQLPSSLLHKVGDN